MNNKKHLSIEAALETISISKACHEANRILCEACGHDPIPSWDEASRLDEGKHNRWSIVPD